MSSGKAFRYHAECTQLLPRGGLPRASHAAPRGGASRDLDTHAHCDVGLDTYLFYTSSVSMYAS